MLKGLEASIIPCSSLENLQTFGAEYYNRRYVEDQTRLRSGGHKLATLGTLCILITDGDHGIADYQDVGVPFILSENVKEGWIDFSSVRSISREHHNALKRSAINDGDVLVTKTGVYFGKSAVFDGQMGEANTIAHVGILRLSKSLDPYFVSTFLNSRYGQSQLRRRGIKATRPEIKLVEFQDIEVPVVSPILTNAIRRTVQRSKEAHRETEKAVDDASSYLSSAIGLDHWFPPEPLTYTATACSSIAAARLDAEFFAPQMRDLIARLSRTGMKIGEVAPARLEKFDRFLTGSCDYIEISDLNGDGTASSRSIDRTDAPSRATWHVRAGDVITSTVRPIRRLSALIEPSQDGYVCSSGFVVLRPERVGSEVLLTYLRLPLICQLMNLHTSASMYPAISEVDLLDLPFVPPDKRRADAVRNAVVRSRAARARASALLNIAKRTVEIAVEKDEAAALQFLNAAGA